MSSLFVIDIDGTIAHAGHRFGKAGAEPSRNNRVEYLAWLDRVQNINSLSEDRPVEGMRSLIRALSSNGSVKVVYLTSREERWRDATLGWLERNGFERASLHMRPNDDWRPTEQFKQEVIQDIQYKNANMLEEVVVIDDDEHGKIEEMCTKAGYTFLKARSGGQR